jgi:hypothetical protein
LTQTPDDAAIVTRRSIGAYGFTLSGLEAPSGLLGAPGGGWPPLRVTSRRGSVTASETVVGDDRASFGIGTRVQALLERSPPSVSFVSEAPITADELVHPCLAPAAALLAHWLGQESFHGGAFVPKGTAWALLGAKGAGKSTTLAALARAGVEVLTDDLLVLRDGAALAGPRCIDLPAESAAALGQEPLAAVPVRGETRLRLRLPRLRPELPLGGFVFTAWGPRVELLRLAPAERLERLLRHRTWALDPVQHGALLDLAGLAAFELRRPATPDSLPAVVDCLLSAIR